MLKNMRVAAKETTDVFMGVVLSGGLALSWLWLTFQQTLQARRRIFGLDAILYVFLRTTLFLGVKGHASIPIEFSCFLTS